MIKALLAIVVPLLVGALLFVSRDSGRGNGVYVEANVRGIVTAIAVPASAAAGSGGPTPLLTAPSVMDGIVHAFVIVSRRHVAAPVSEPTLSLEIVNVADPTFHAEPQRLISRTRRVEDGVREVVSDALIEPWTPGHVVFDYYVRALSAVSGSSDSMTVVVVLDVPSEGPEPRLQYSVVIGPRMAPRRVERKR